MFDTLRLFSQWRTEPWKSTAGFFAEKISDAPPRLLDVFPLHRGIECIGCIWIETLPSGGSESHRDEPPISPDNLPQRQIELPPPLHSGSIAKRTHHENAGAFSMLARSSARIGTGTGKAV
jgi:hypothetical protein